MQKILIAEDDPVIRDGLQFALDKEGYDVLLATDGEEALHYIRSINLNLVVLDIMMPHMNGFEVITEMRRQGITIPILVLTARSEVHDRVRGLDLGADDYVTKPFALIELLARIRRRVGVRAQNSTVFGDFVYDWQTCFLYSAGKEAVDLSTRERKLLELFLQRPNRIIERETILNLIWGEGYEGTDRTVDNFIVRLRRKIGGSYIQTERGIGYRFLKNIQR